MAKKGILLINLGTPDSPNTADVRKYLKEFLMDGRVIDLPYWWRTILVKGIIAPFRAPKSAEGYKQLWTKDGSPLLHYAKIAQKELQQHLGENYIVELAMRYQNPPIEKAMERLRKANIEVLQMIPFYPQYASSSTGSCIQKFTEELSKWETIPKVNVTSSFCDNDALTTTIASNAKQKMTSFSPQHFVFSYHGLPERHIKNGCETGFCKVNGDCCQQLNENNHNCYMAQCYKTSEKVAEKLGLKRDDYSVCFQSRLETRAKDPWIKPYTDMVLENLAKNGKKNLLIFSPSFVADCLETTVEIGIEYKEDFIKNGGEELVLVPSLNEDISWLKSLVEV